MTRDDILKQAHICISGERDKEYGVPEDSFAAIALLWTAYLKSSHLKLQGEINKIDAAIMMGLLKIARISKGYKADNFIDLAGYAACAGEIATSIPEEIDGQMCLFDGADT